MSDFVVYADGGRRTMAAHVRKNTARVFLDSEYIGQSHTLGIPAGRYTTNSLNSLLSTNYSRLDRIHDLSPAGDVYLLWNPAWPAWVKVGMTTDVTRRLGNYQTGSPMRDFKLVHSRHFADRADAERRLLDHLSTYGERRGEWVCLPRHFALRKLVQISD